MGQMWQRVGSLKCAFLSLGTVCTTAAGAQGIPAERPVPPPAAEAIRGFTSVTSVRELDGGRTLVSDRGERRLYLVNWETGAVDQISRRGDGPGEYREVGWLYAVGDSETLLTDHSNRRWILLRDINVARTFSGTEPLNARFGARLSGVDSDGRVLASVSADRPGNVVADEHVLELAPGSGPHEDLPRLDTLRFVKAAGRDQLACVLVTSGAPRCRFLPAEEQAILFPDGWIAVALQDPYRIDWRSPDGDWIRGEVLANASVPVSEAEKCAAINGWAEGDVGCDAAAVGRYVWPETVPPFLTDSRACRACRELAAGAARWLFADPGGRLVVRRTPQRSRKENVYDIVDRTGRRVERLTLPHGEAIVGIGESSLYTIRVDETDLQWLRRHAWRD